MAAKFLRYKWSTSLWYQTKTWYKTRILYISFLIQLVYHACQHKHTIKETNAKFFFFFLTFVKVWTNDLVLLGHILHSTVDWYAHLFSLLHADFGSWRQWNDEAFKTCSLTLTKGMSLVSLRQWGQVNKDSSFSPDFWTKCLVMLQLDSLWSWMFWLRVLDCGVC